MPIQPDLQKPVCLSIRYTFIPILSSIFPKILLYFGGIPQAPTWWDTVILPHRLFTKFFLAPSVFLFPGRLPHSFYFYFYNQVLKATSPLSCTWHPCLDICRPLTFAILAHILQVVAERRASDLGLHCPFVKMGEFFRGTLTARVWPCLLLENSLGQFKWLFEKALCLRVTGNRKEYFPKGLHMYCWYWGSYWADVEHFRDGAKWRISLLVLRPYVWICFW